MATNRHLAAIMFTDITGFSAMMQTNEEFAKMIRKRHREVFRGAHERFGGKILQYYGDGTLSIFDSATAAVECAVEMQIEFRKEPEVPLRIGIHTGDISYDEEGAYGDGLNVAARVERMCETGAVFITGKVYDDIKNHRWLTAISLGRFDLKNIFQHLEIFAVTSKGLPVPTEEEVMSYPEYRPAGGQQVMGNAEFAPPVGRKKKGIAFVMALLLGYFGIHRFYLGQPGKAIFLLIFAIICIAATAAVDGRFPLAVIPAIIAFIDAVMFLAMPREDFDAKYNAKYVAAMSGQTQYQDQRKRTREPVARRVPDAVPTYQSRRRASTQVEGPTASPLIRQGVKLFKKGRYRDAIDKFEAALKQDPDNVVAMFNLACCHSMLHNAEESFYYLARSVEYGFDDFQKIHEHEALTYIRSLAAYMNFVRNGYRVVPKLPTPQEDLLEKVDTFDPTILDKIENLGQLLDRGELSRDEFEKEKQKILKREE